MKIHLCRQWQRFSSKLHFPPVLPALFGSPEVFCVTSSLLLQAVTGLCRKVNIFLLWNRAYTLIRRDRSLATVHNQMSRNLELLFT